MEQRRQKTGRGMRLGKDSRGNTPTLEVGGSRKVEQVIRFQPGGRQNQGVGYDQWATEFGKETWRHSAVGSHPRAHQSTP